MRSDVERHMKEESDLEGETGETSVYKERYTKRDSNTDMCIKRDLHIERDLYPYMKRFVYIERDLYIWIRSWRDICIYGETCDLHYSASNLCI